MGTFTETRIFFVETCITCGIEFGMPDEYVKQLRRKESSFCCPNGHSMVYGPSDLKKKEAEIANLKNQLQLAQETRRRAQNDADHFKASRNALRGQITKIKKRIGNGVCPCCNRTFQDLQRHMHTKHPEYQSEETE